MMIKINLLPPQNKKEVELLGVKKLATSLMAWILIFLIVFSLILAAMYLYLSVLLRSQGQLFENEQSDSQMQQLLELEEIIKEVNDKIDQIGFEQRGSIYWTPVFEELASLTSDSIYLTDFHYQAENNQIGISGWADSRDDLLAFQEELEKSPLFDEVEAPLTNLLKQKNIDFDFTLKPLQISADKF